MYLISIPFIWHSQEFLARVEPSDEPDFDIYKLDLYLRIELSYHKLNDDLVDYLASHTDLPQIIEEAQDNSPYEPDLSE